MEPVNKRYQKFSENGTIKRYKESTDYQLSLKQYFNKYLFIYFWEQHNNIAVLSFDIYL